MDIALDHLTEAEQDAIYAVLRRDDQLRTQDHDRIRQLQNDVKKIKLAGVIKPGIDANKTCARCRKEFGWIFNKGQICPNCQHKVCENCRVNLKTGSWLCVLCKKQREIEAMSGQWFYKKFRKSKRNKKTNQVISGNDIIRASIRKPTPPRYGRIRNSEFEQRGSGKRTISPTYLGLGSDGGGEDSDTQSTEMGHTSRHLKRQDLAFPKTSDQARLQNLIVGGTVGATASQGATRRVITVGGNRDSSSSESEPGSPTSPKSKNPFTHIDSVHSSGRSASPVSAISSEGHMTMVTERDISDIESLRSAISGMEDFDSRRSAENLRAEAPPPRRLAKTAEQERLEALQEKSQEDLAGYSDSDDRVDNTSEANGGIMPDILVSEATKDASLGRRSKTSAMSDGSSLVEPRFDDEDDEDIDELFSSAATHRSISNLNSTYSESRESIASYYSDAGEGSKYPVTGDIEFGAHYNYTTGIFEVNIKKCRNIAAVDAKRKRTDPYVKAYLLPDKNRAGKRKTKVKKHTLNPVFDEILRFSITKSELESRTLSLSVWHNDKFGRNDFLGEIALPLDSFQIDTLKPDWYPLLDRVAPLSPTSVVTYKGDLLISMKFEQNDPQQPGTLLVLVKECRNLTPKDNGTSDPFCKGYLLPDKSTKQSKQKTAVKKKTVNPKWDHTLTFPGVNLSDLTQRSLELTVWDHDRFNRNDFLGGVRLNLGTGKSEGQDVEWMDAKGEEISLWQSMLHRPNVWIDSNLMLRASMDKRPGTLDI